MPLSRRHLLAVAGAISAFTLVEHGTRAASAAVGATLAGMRPRPHGTSADRCALCGASDHTMLDARCPRARPMPPVA